MTDRAVFPRTTDISRRYSQRDCYFTNYFYRCADVRRTIVFFLFDFSCLCTPAWCAANWPATRSAFVTGGGQFGPAEVKLPSLTLENKFVSPTGCSKQTFFRNEDSNAPLTYPIRESQRTLSLSTVDKCAVNMAASSFIDCNEKKAITLETAAISVSRDTRGYILQVRKHSSFPQNKFNITHKYFDFTKRSPHGCYGKCSHGENWHCCWLAIILLDCINQTTFNLHAPLYSLLHLEPYSFLFGFLVSVWFPRFQSNSRQHYQPEHSLPKGGLTSRRQLRVV